MSFAAFVVASASIGKVAIDLFNSKVTQLLVSEKVLPDGRHVVHLVGVLWVFLLVRRVPRSLRPCERHEAGRSVRYWLSRPNHVTVEEAIVCHAQPHGTTLEKFLHARCVSFEIVPLLWLPPRQEKRKQSAGEIEQTLGPPFSSMPLQAPCWPSAAQHSSGRERRGGRSRGPLDTRRARFPVFAVRNSRHTCKHTGARNLRHCVGRRAQREQNWD